MSLLLASTMWFPINGRGTAPTPHVWVHRSEHRKCFGGHSERETPGHIPNPEAKTLSADGTARETSWESRTPPDFFTRKAPRSTAPGGLSHTRAILPWLS